MFISTTKYNAIQKELSDAMEYNGELCKEKKKLQDRIEKQDEEIKRLANIISASNKECKVGPWCKDCDHVRHDNYGVRRYSPYGGYYYENPDEDEVMYCVKHLHELCPEHSKNSQEE